MKNYVFIIIMVIIICYIVSSVRKNKLSIKESFLWTMGGIVGLIFSIFPKILDGLAEILGIDYPPSLLFLIFIIFLLLLNFRYSKIFSVQQIKINELSQQIAIIKEKIGKK